MSGFTVQLLLAIGNAAFMFVQYGSGNYKLACLNAFAAGACFVWSGALLRDR